MKTAIALIAICALLSALASCSQEPPTGAFRYSVVSSEPGAESALSNAYAALTGEITALGFLAQPTIQVPGVHSTEFFGHYGSASNITIRVSFNRTEKANEFILLMEMRRSPEDWLPGEKQSWNRLQDNLSKYLDN